MGPGAAPAMALALQQGQRGGGQCRACAAGAEGAGAAQGVVRGGKRPWSAGPHREGRPLAASQAAVQRLRDRVPSVLGSMHMVLLC